MARADAGPRVPARPVAAARVVGPQTARRAIVVRQAVAQWVPGPGTRAAHPGGRAELGGRAVVTGTVSQPARTATASG